MKEKLHILFISNWFPNRTNVFSGDFTQRHAQAISTKHKVSVIHIVGDKNVNKQEIVTNTKTENYTEYILYFPNSKYKILNFFTKYKALSTVKNKVKNIDLIHANVIHYHFVWLLFQPEKYIITEHLSAFLQINIHKLSKTKKYIYKIIYNKSCHITTVSNTLWQGLKSITQNPNQTRIPNIVDVNLFKIGNAKPQHNFLHISNLKEVKNVEGMLQAIKLVAEKGYDFKFSMGGNGSEQKIKDYIISHNLEKYIQILPALSHAEVVAQMHNHKCFVLFSHYENQPCVINESFSCGLPVIATNVGGVSEFFPDNFGILIEKGNVEQLANAMIAVLNNKQFSKPEIMHNYAKDNFSTQIIAESFDEIYKKVLKND